MAKWDVEVSWRAVATVRVEAKDKREAKFRAASRILDRGLPWDQAASGGKWLVTAATLVEEGDDEPREGEPHGPLCPSRVGGECLCGVADRLMGL